MDHSTVKFSFLKELTEARMFRNSDSLGGKTATNLAKISFLSLLALEIMRTLNPGYAKKYALDTISYENFKSMRNNATDLHNLLTVLNNQTDYAGKIQTDPEVAIPALQIKRYLRDMENNRKDKSLDRQFFYKLEGFLKINDPELKELRRNVVDWNMNSSVEKRNVIRTIKQELNKLSLQLDLLQQFKALRTE
jgi:hypothetical protein